MPRLEFSLSPWLTRMGLNLIRGNSATWMDWIPDTTNSMVGRESVSATLWVTMPPAVIESRSIWLTAMATASASLGTTFGNYYGAGIGNFALEI